MTTHNTDDAPEYRVRTIDNTMHAIVLKGPYEERLIAWSNDEQAAEEIRDALNEGMDFRWSHPKADSARVLRLVAPTSTYALLKAGLALPTGCVGASKKSPWNLN